MQPSISCTPTSAIEKKQIALAVAEQCTELLKQEFGATEVIVFGSLRGDTPWHRESDLDLAVQGVAPDVLWQAYKQLEAIVPSWLPFDLVALERAERGIRDRILQLTPMPKNPYLALKIHLEDELVALERTIDTLNILLTQAASIPKIALVPALAGYIEDFYTGCERLAERITVALEDGLPEGKNWHEQLLQQMAKPSLRGRPPLWDQALLSELETYRRFRHRVRHLYNFDLNDERVLALAQHLPEVWVMVSQAVGTFGQWLGQQAIDDK